MHADLIRGERNAVLTERGGADGALNQSDLLQVLMRVLRAGPIRNEQSDTRDVFI